MRLGFCTVSESHPLSCAAGPAYFIYRQEELEMDATLHKV